MKHSVCLIVAALVMASQAHVMAQWSAPITEADMHAMIKAANPNYTGTGKVYKSDKDGIWGLDVSRCNIITLEFLRGMPLKAVACADNNIRDLYPLMGMKLLQLVCNNNPIDDLSPIAGMPIWKLDIKGTKVADITPLEGMKLQEFDFSPQNIAKGIDIVRNMKTIEFYPTPEQPDKSKNGDGIHLMMLMKAEKFWELYDEQYGKKTTGVQSAGGKQTPSLRAPLAAPVNSDGKINAPRPASAPLRMARAADAPRPYISPLQIYTSLYWAVICESVQYASVVKESLGEIQVNLKGIHPANSLAVVLLCTAIDDPPEDFCEVTEMPVVQLVGGGALRYVGYQAEFLKRQPQASPSWMEITPKSGPRTIRLGPPYSGDAKLAMHRGDRMRLKVAYEMADSRRIPPEGMTKIYTSQGSVNWPFPLAPVIGEYEPSGMGQSPATSDVPESHSARTDGDALQSDDFDRVRLGDAKAKVQAMLGPGGFFKMGKTEVLVYPKGQITIENGLVTAIDRSRGPVVEAPAPHSASLSGNKNRTSAGSRQQKAKKPVATTPRSSSQPESDFLNSVFYRLPSNGDVGTIGFNEVCVQNPNKFAVAVCVLNHSGGCRKFEVPAYGSASTHVNEGYYSIYFIYANDPTSLYQGDDFKISSRQRIEIKLVMVRNGNFGIKKVR